MEQIISNLPSLDTLTTWLTSSTELPMWLIIILILLLVWKFTKSLVARDWRSQATGLSAENKVLRGELKSAKDRADQLTTENKRINGELVEQARKTPPMSPN